MSILIYNCIKIDVIQTVRYRREAVYDGRTYLYTRHYVHVRGVCDPSYTSYSLGGASSPNVLGDDPAINRAPFKVQGITKTNGGVNPIGDELLPQGNNANISDQTIRHLLMQPRRKLLYYAGDLDPADNPRAAETLFAANGFAQPSLILECPYRNRAGNADTPNYRTDAKYGPFPKIYDVWRIDGTSCFRVEFAVECLVHEADLYLNKPPLLLSNEWEMDQDIDQDGFTTQSVRGRARFRADILEQQRTHPDDYRRFLLLPVPPGFKRENLRVRASDDGASVWYNFRDRQRSHSFTNIGFGAGGVPGAGTPFNHTRLEAYATVKQSQESIAGGLAADARDSIKFGAGFNIEKPFNQLGQFFEVGQRNFERHIPKMKVSILVRVWGNPFATRALLLVLAEYVIVAKLPGLAGLRGDVLSDTEIEWQFDLMGRFVQVTKSFSIPPLTNAIVQGLGKLSDKQIGLMGGWLGTQAAKFLRGGEVPAGANVAPPGIPALTQDKLPELFAQDDIILPSALVGNTGDRPYAKANLGWSSNPVNGYLPDLTWPAGNYARSAFAKLCVAAALSTWQTGPGVPPTVAPDALPGITPVY